MRKIFVSAGHTNTPGRDRGASGNGFIEGALNEEFRELLLFELKLLGVKGISDGKNTILSESIRFFKNKTSTNSIVLDIHFNAATPKATGTETLIPKISSKFERELAEKLSATIGNTLGIQLRGRRGVKTEADSHHGRLGWMRLKGENILLEICFITNKKDIKSYQTNKYLLAKKIAKILFDYANTDPKSSDIEYNVIKGDSLWEISKKFNVSISKLKSLNKLKSNTIYIGQKLLIK